MTSSSFWSMMLRWINIVVSESLFCSFNYNFFPCFVGDISHDFYTKHLPFFIRVEDAVLHYLSRKTTGGGDAAGTTWDDQPVRAQHRLNMLQLLIMGIFCWQIISLMFLVGFLGAFLIENMPMLLAVMATGLLVLFLVKKYALVHFESLGSVQAEIFN